MRSHRLSHPLSKNPVSAESVAPPSTPVSRGMQATPGSNPYLPLGRKLSHLPRRIPGPAVKLIYATQFIFQSACLAPAAKRRPGGAVSEGLLRQERRQMLPPEPSPYCPSSEGNSSVLLRSTCRRAPGVNPTRFVNPFPGWGCHPRVLRSSSSQARRLCIPWAAPCHATTSHKTAQHPFSDFKNIVFIKTNYNMPGWESLRYIERGREMVTLF